MITVVWTEESLSDLLRLQGFLLEINVSAATSAIEAIQSAAERLSRFPGVGVKLEGSQHYRELYVRFGGGVYVMRYRRRSEEPEAAVIVTRV